MRKQLKKTVVLGLLVFAAVALGGAIVYVFGPAKKTDFVYSFSGLEGNSYACNTILGTTLFPVVDLGKEITDPAKAEAEAFAGGTSIALEVEDDTVRFLTATSVEGGMMELMVMPILKNDDDVLAAVKYFPSSGIQGSAEINTLIVNKKNWLCYLGKDEGSVFILRPSGRPGVLPELFPNRIYGSRSSEWLACSCTEPR